MKVTVTFPEIVETFDLGDISEKEFLEDPEAHLDMYVSDVNHEWDWEMEEDA